MEASRVYYCNYTYYFVHEFASARSEDGRTRSFYDSEKLTTQYAHEVHIGKVIRIAYLTLSLLSSKSTFSQPSKEKMHKQGSENFY